MFQRAAPNHRAIRRFQQKRHRRDLQIGINGHRTDAVAAIDELRAFDAEHFGNIRAVNIGVQQAD